jgi:hypothetical protein
LKRDRAKLRGSNLELCNKIYGLEDSLSKSQKRVLDLESRIHDLESYIASLENSCSSNSNAFNNTRMHRNVEPTFPAGGYVNQSYVSDKDASFTSLPLPNRYTNSGSSLHNHNYEDDSNRRLSMVSVRSNGSTASGRAKAVPDGAGKYFSCEDEEDLFALSSKNLEDLKRGRCGGGVSNQLMTSSRASDINSHFGDVDPFGRLSELQRRNTLVPMHMRSCYPGEELDGIVVDENQLRGLPGARASKRFAAESNANNAMNRRETMSGAIVGLSGKSLSGPNVRNASSVFVGGENNDRSRLPNINNGVCQIKIAFRFIYNFTSDCGSL